MCGVACRAGRGRVDPHPPLTPAPLHPTPPTHPPTHIQLRLDHVTPLPSALQPSDGAHLNFLGPHVPAADAEAVAQGRRQPITRRTYPPHLARDGYLVRAGMCVDARPHSPHPRTPHTHGRAPRRRRSAGGSCRCCGRGWWRPPVRSGPGPVRTGGGCLPMAATQRLHASWRGRVAVGTGVGVRQRRLGGVRGWVASGMPWRALRWAQRTVRTRR